MKQRRMCDEFAELVKEWHPTKNGSLRPQDITCGSDVQIWWKCKNTHEWIASVSHRTNKKSTGCPYCSGRYAIKGMNDLRTLFPDVAKEWHPERNIDISLNNIKAGSSKKVWWKCKKGHEWQATVSHRTKKNSKCPYCSGRYAIKGENDLQTLMPNLAREWHPTKNPKLLPTEVKLGSNYKVWWICKYGHEWEAAIVDRTRKNGSGCPYCAGNLYIKGKTDLQTMYPDIAREWHPTKNGELNACDVAKHSGKKVWWKCKKGHEWQSAIITRTRVNAGCPYCAGQKVIKGENDLLTCAPELVKEWNDVRNNGLTPSEVTFSSGKKVWWICEKGHEWQAVISTRTGKANCKCPYCSGRYAIPGETDLQTLMPEVAQEWHPTKNRNLLASKIPLYSNKKVWWLCEKGHEWRATISMRTSRGTGCPECAKYAKMS